MRKLFKYLLMLLGMVLVVVALVAGGGYAYLRRSLPQATGVIEHTGLRSGVEISIDVDAVPHIYAESKLDAYWALGYLHAQQRLWQMELQRRVTQGRLAEVFGPAGLSNDRFLRTLGLHTAAQEAYDSFDAQYRQVIDEYTKGINFFIASNNGSRLPPEFTVLGLSAEPWTGADVLSIAKMMAWNLDSISYSTELLYRDISKAVGLESAQDLMPGYSEGAAGGVQAGGDAGSYERLIGVGEEVGAMSGFGGLNKGGLGSNSWVVDGTKSATGRPVLANDIHLGTSMPSIWLMAHLSAGEFDLVGATIPGLPVVVAGRNRSIAWGVTHLVADVQDIFRERLDDTRQMAEFKGQFEPIRVITEKIKVSGQGEVEHRVRITRHGPLISDALNANDSDAPAERRPPALEPLALRWTALDPGDTTVEALLRLNDSRNWEEFKQALRRQVAPALNFTYADVQGNVGLYAAGLVPLRTGGDGSTPVEGWTGAGEWEGWVPFESLPHLYNPPAHFIVTANDRPAMAETGSFLGSQWAQPYRADRISSLLQVWGNLSLQDHAAIQRDTVSLQARELLPLLIDVIRANADDENRAIEILKKWDGDTRGDSAAAVIYESWLARLPGAVAGDELGQRLGRRYDERFDYVARFLMNVLKGPARAWCDDVTTPEKEDCSIAAERALRMALDNLRMRLGADMSSWRWDEVHRAVFPHQPFHNFGPLRGFFSRSVPNGGDGSTVNFAPFGFNRPFDQTSAPGYRQVIELSDSGKSLFIQAGGLSGHFLSPHYDDYLSDWQAVRYRSLRFDRDVVDRDRASTLRLEP